MTQPQTCLCKPRLRKISLFNLGDAHPQISRVISMETWGRLRSLCEHASSVQPNDPSLVRPFHVADAQSFCSRVLGAKARSIETGESSIRRSYDAISPMNFLPYERTTEPVSTCRLLNSSIALRRIASSPNCFAEIIPSKPWPHRMNPMMEKCGGTNL